MGVRYTSGKLAEEMLRKLTYIVLYKLKIPFNSKMITLTKMDLSADKSVARIYVSVIEGKEIGLEVVRKLNSARRIINRILIKSMYIKRLPEFNFVYDESLEKSVKMNRMLDELVPLGGEE